MARTKTVGDEAILDAAMALMVREGPKAVTFAAVGREVGLSAATLVQRYATKADFLHAVLWRAWNQLDEQTARLDASAALSPEGAVRMLVALSPVGEGEFDFAEGLLILREDMRDPLLRERGAQWRATMAVALGRRLSDDPHRQAMLGRMMASQWQGAQLWWAFERRGDAVSVIGDELRRWCEVVLKAERVAG
ncbi:TetR/AcrR family transcriptional regulator [Pseudomonas citronellolis]|uniref:TetR/AcrR family transcriptional regulator n=1 Tax=Pseudomonas citronellolis TaxID=53408 RepID=UPI0023E3BE88|nr:helix-turn-helix domain-containing protein [Pseudomonas citronellolis]MDF3932229.1 helix-turn-helix domain containing protein [Pseudomonas citronellolis]